MRTITREEALHALNEAVASKGYDYVDADAAMGHTCRNIRKQDDGTWVPSCIVGTALVWLGIPIEWFVETDCHAVSVATVAERLHRASLVNIPEDVLDFLADAQTKQDQKHPWGEAVAYAYLGWNGFNELQPREEA